MLDLCEYAYNISDDLCYSQFTTTNNKYNIFSRALLIYYYIENFRLYFNFKETFFFFVYGALSFSFKLSVCLPLDDSMYYQCSDRRSIHLFFFIGIVDSGLHRDHHLLGRKSFHLVIRQECDHHDGRCDHFSHRRIYQHSGDYFFIPTRKQILITQLSTSAFYYPN